MTKSRYAYQKERERERAARRLEEKDEPVVTVKRDPCIGCGVPGHRHDECGCSDYRPRRYG